MLLGRRGAVKAQAVAPRREDEGENGPEGDRLESARDLGYKSASEEGGMSERAKAAVAVAAAAICSAATLAFGGAAAREAGAGGAEEAERAEGRAPLQGDEVVGLLRDYLRIDTSNPPGNEMRAARFFRSLFDKEDIRSEIFEVAPGRAVLLARLPGTGAKPGLLLLNHTDVVNAERPYWTVDPFSGELKDGYVYGRGALDMKATGLLEAVTLINLARSGERLRRDVLFLASADEEVGALGINWVVTERPDLVKGVEYLLNEGGVIDQIGGAARTYSVGVTEKCPLWLKITARGRPGHGSQPFGRDNAVLTLLRALDRLRRYETPIRVTPAAEAYFKARAATERPERAAKFRNIRAALKDPAFRRTLEADPALNAIIRNTIAITMLEGAPQTNIIPTVAEARVDVRLLPDEDPKVFLEAIRRMIGDAAVTVEPIGAFTPATASPVDSEVMRAIDRARARHHPEAVLAPVILTGWTESNLMRTLGIKAYGFEPYVLDETEQERAHGNDERISVENVMSGEEILREIVLDVAR